jgi:RNA polymerase sigma factor (TIGR02999 family)
MQDSPTITDLLKAWNSGDTYAFERLIPVVEKELHQIAARHMRRERPNHTLQTTALMNEAYLKLIRQNRVHWQNRAHFFAIASQIMRRILLDYAKSQTRLKRGKSPFQVELHEENLVIKLDLESLIALDEALRHLAEIDPLKSKIVEMRHFGGLSVEETAAVMGLSEVTVMRHWSLAKAWLRRELKGERNSAK